MATAFPLEHPVRSIAKAMMFSNTAMIVDADAKNIQRKKGDEGFSLIELVIAVGILAILSIVGVVAYKTLNNQARQAAVENAAAVVLKAAAAYDIDGSKKPVDARDEWMNTSGNGRGSKPITVELTDENNCITVSAVHDAGNHAERSYGTGCEGGSKFPENGTEGGITDPGNNDHEGNPSTGDDSTNDDTTNGGEDNTDIDTDNGSSNPDANTNDGEENTDTGTDDGSSNPDNNGSEVGDDTDENSNDEEG